jgi:hypothetical protein
MRATVAQARHLLKTERKWRPAMQPLLAAGERVRRYRFGFGAEACDDAGL